MSKATVQQVWEKGETIPGRDPKEWRRDFLGFFLQRSLYGVQDGYGWGLLYCGPARKTKRDELADLEPCNWQLVADDAIDQKLKAQRQKTHQKERRKERQKERRKERQKERRKARRVAA